jgi:uncharacterized membrane protein YphA (DoxX/SURF4 family)
LRCKIKNIFNSAHLALVFRIILGIVFIYSGLEKIIYAADFAATIQNYQLIPVELTNLVAIILPWLEFYCGLFILFALFKQASTAIISVLLIFFMVALASVIFRGLDIDCGCFGGSSDVSWFRVIEDLLLLAMSLYLFFIPSQLASLNGYLVKFRKRKS